MDLHYGSKATYMHQAGLVDIAVLHWAVREWPETERIGRLFLVPWMMEGLRFSEGEVRAFVGETWERLRAENRLGWVVYVMIGRKPVGQLCWGQTLTSSGDHFSLSSLRRVFG